MKWENDGAENTAFQLKISLDTFIVILDNAKEKYQLTWKHSNKSTKGDTLIIIF